MAKKRYKGDVKYYLELDRYKYARIYSMEFCNLQYKLPKGRPIAYSTKATSDWLKYLKSISNSWEEMLLKANGSTGEFFKDIEAMNVINSYINHKSDFNKVIWD